MTLDEQFADIIPEVAVIYGANSTNWEDNAWLSTTIAFGIIGGIYIWGPMISVVKHVRIQIIVMATLTCTFSGALAASNQHNKPLAAAFSFLTTFPNGILELIPASLVQMDANDADLGTVFGKFHVENCASLVEIDRELAILFTMRTVLGSVFTAIYLAILNNKLPTEIQSHVESAATAAGLPTSVYPSLFAAVANGTSAAYNDVPGMTSSIEADIMNAVTDGRVKSYSYIYFATIAVNAMPIIAGFLMKDYDHLMNAHVPRQIYRNGVGAVHEGVGKGAVDDDQMETARQSSFQEEKSAVQHKATAGGHGKD